MLTRSELKSGFIAVDIPLSIGGAVHQLYVKEHTGRDLGQASETTSSSSAASGVTLFVGNVDMHLNMSHEDIDGYLRELMSQFGDIQAVYVSALTTEPTTRSRKRTRTEMSADDEDDNEQDDGVRDMHSLTTGRSRFAHVQFVNKKGLSSFLKAAKSGQLAFITQKVGAMWGLADGYSVLKSVSAIRKELSFKNAQSTETLKSDVNQYMQEFEEREAVEKAQAKAREADVDDDGFKLVKARNTRKKSSADGKQTKGRKRGTKQKKHKGTLELKNFYRFQFREQKKEALLTLREAFAKDQEKIAQLKEQRKFKPF